MEKWKTINDYPDYEVSSLGRVRKKGGKCSRNNKREDSLLIQSRNGNGYPCVRLRRWEPKTDPKTIMVHRLVAEAFLDGSGVVDHINGDRTDNRAENLQFITQSENIKKFVKSNPNKIWNGSKQVKCLETDEVFRSCSECARSIGVRQSSLSIAISKGFKCRGLTFIYV